MNSCCVVGGGGFIGQHVVKALASEGRRVVILDRRHPAESKLVHGNVEYAVGDYAEKDILFNALKSVEEVILLAYWSVPKTSFEDPVQDILKNLPPTVGLLQTASELGIQKVLIVSSGGTVYGNADTLPITERHPTNPISPYGITKLTTEKYAYMFGKVRELPTVCLRAANAYGEGQKPFTGQGFIATAIASILTEREIRIFGASGTVRDYIHVTDVAKGVVAALKYGKLNTCYNVGSGVGRSTMDVLDVLRPLARKAGLDPIIKVLPRRPYDVAANILDCGNIRQDTGWKPTVQFEDGIEGSWEWMRREGLRETKKAHSKVL